MIIQFSPMCDMLVEFEESQWLDRLEYKCGNAANKILVGKYFICNECEDRGTESIKLISGVGGILGQVAALSALCKATEAKLEL